MCAGTLMGGCYRGALTNLVVDAHTVWQLSLIRGEWIAIIADLGRRCMPLALRRAYATPTPSSSPFRRRGCGPECNLWWRHCPQRHAGPCICQSSWPMLRQPSHTLPPSCVFQGEGRPVSIAFLPPYFRLPLSKHPAGPLLQALGPPLTVFHPHIVLQRWIARRTADVILEERHKQRPTHR
jgi:hypothetical protein